MVLRTLYKTRCIMGVTMRETKMNKTEMKNLIEELHSNNGSGSPIVKKPPKKKEVKTKKEKKTIEKKAKPEVEAKSIEKTKKYTKEQFERLPAYRHRKYNFQQISDTEILVHYGSLLKNAKTGASMISQVRERIIDILNKRQQKVYTAIGLEREIGLTGSSFGDYANKVMKSLIAEGFKGLKMHNVAKEGAKTHRYEYHLFCDCDLCKKS